MGRKTGGSTMVIELYYTNDNPFHLEIEMRLSQKKLAATLKHHGYKLTPQRRAIISAIASSPNHPAVGLATVYRTLEILAKLELICELHAGGGRSYTTTTPGHHHHLICAQCGEVIDFSGYHLAELEKRLSHQTGFEIEGHLLEFTGRCQHCRQNA